ncbi:MAG: DUF1345 domain-containing protein [Microthrixaceae bacterium]
MLRWPTMTLRNRVLSAALVGGATVAVFVLRAPWQATLMAGFCASALMLLLLVWSSVLATSGEESREMAERADDTAAGASIAVLGASVSALVAVVLGLIKAQHLAGGQKAAMTTLAVATVVLAWLLVHTIYTLRYARLYFEGEPGGIDFNLDDGEHPDYYDFAYLAFSVGMTFQVSDTDIHARTIRRAVLRHSLISFMFGTAIIGTTINVMAGLVH